MSLDRLNQILSDHQRKDTILTKQYDTELLQHLQEKLENEQKKQTINDQRLAEESHHIKKIAQYLATENSMLDKFKALFQQTKHHHTDAQANALRAELLQSLNTALADVTTSHDLFLKNMQPGPTQETVTITQPKITQPSELNQLVQKMIQTMTQKPAPTQQQAPTAPKPQAPQPQAPTQKQTPTAPKPQAPQTPVAKATPQPTQPATSQTQQSTQAKPAPPQPAQPTSTQQQPQQTANQAPKTQSHATKSQAPTQQQHPPAPKTQAPTTKPMDPLAQSLKDLPKQPQLSDARLMDSAAMHTPKKSKAKANTQTANPLAKPTAKPAAKPATGTPSASTGAEAPSLITSLNETQTVSLSSMAAVQPTPEKLAQQQTEAMNHQHRGESAVKLDTPADAAQKKLQAYAAAYLGVKKETKSTGTVQDQRSELLASGVSEGDLQELETGIVTVAKTQLKHQMKHMARTQILTEFGSDGELDKQNAHALEHGIKQLRDQLKANGKVGDPDQIHDWHHEAVYEAMDEVADAIRVYRLETFKDFKTQELAGDPAAPETEKQYEELGQLGFKLGAFDYKEAFKLTDQFTLDLYDLGSLLFESDMDMDQNPHTPTPYTYSQSDEHDILLDRLRAILMNVALTGGVLNQISSQFKIQKIKNGLVKLGVYNEDLLHTLTQETEAEAIQILTKILHECCLEHASFYRLSGIDYEQNKRKFKATVRNLNRLGVSISDTQLDQYQADANRAMYPAIVNAYRRAVVSGYDTQQHQLLQTASRLRTETPDLSAYTSPDMEGPLMALNHDQFSESV